MNRNGLIRWLQYRLGLCPARTQTSQVEQDHLKRYASGKRCIVEIGVCNGVNTARMRQVMDSRGIITGIDPFRPGRLGINFDMWIALREVAKHPNGQVVLVRKFSHKAVNNWTLPIDFLFIDGDHSWAGIDRDWRDWSSHVAVGGHVALHDSRSVPNRADLDSVRYTQEVILRDPRFRQIDAVDSLTILERKNW